jgi:hypothetical protein
MAADQPNRGYFTYVDDGGGDWNVFGSIDPVCNAIDGNAALNPANPVFGRESRRRHVRKLVFQDPTTLRTKTCIMYTASAYNTAIATPPTLAVHVQGETGTVDYTLKARIPEKLPIAAVGRNDPDHA